MMTPREGIVFAISLFGSDAKLAEAIAYTPAAVSWAKRTGRISARMAANIEVATRGKITRAILCPDLFKPKIKLALDHGWVRNGKKAGARA